MKYVTITVEVVEGDDGLDSLVNREQDLMVLPCDEDGEPMLGKAKMIVGYISIREHDIEADQEGS